MTQRDSRLRPLAPYEPEVTPSQPDHQAAGWLPTESVAPYAELPDRAAGQGDRTRPRWRRIPGI